MTVDGRAAQMVLQKAVLHQKTLFELLHFAVLVLELCGLDLFLLSYLFEGFDLFFVSSLLANFVVIEAAEAIDLGLELTNTLARVRLALAGRVSLARKLFDSHLVFLQLFAQVVVHFVVVARVGSVRA